MNLTKILLATIVMLTSSTLFARNGGDDAGNGGFAYRQSVIILKMATEALETKIVDSTLKDIVDHPERRAILQETLGYKDLDKFSKKNQYRGGRKLAMNYIVSPPGVVVLKPYFEAFAGTTDRALEDASLEVQKRLLHEAAHIWGYSEEPAEQFAIAFLLNTNGETVRPSHDIKIKDFCTCRNSKSENNKSCDDFCSDKPNTDSSILYVNTIMGPATMKNSKLGSLYNWCHTKLANDISQPQCILNANDGTSNNYIQVDIDRRSNTFSANVTNLEYSRNWTLTLSESKSGPYAEIEKFELNRVRNPIPGQEDRGALLITSINQFSCINYGMDSNGNRDGYAKKYYYFNANETPAPIPPVGGGRQSSIVCHDEQMHPGDDSIEYPRLESLFGHFLGWDKVDPRFLMDSDKLRINKIIDSRLLSEYGVNLYVDLFRPLHYAAAGKPTFKNFLGYVMIPFSDVSGRSFCPTEFNYKSSVPLFNLLADYMGDTEGLYVAEKEPELVTSNDNMTYFYGSMLIRQSSLLKYGFFITESGIKTPITSETLHQKTVYYYWPTDPTVDSLKKGNRKLFTIMNPSMMHESGMSSLPNSTTTSDKRIGCIPKLEN